MNNILLSILLLYALVPNANAEEAKAEITSFRYAGIRTQAAELCGKVTSDSFPLVAKIVVDHKTDKPGIYNTIVGSDGKFCTAVITYRGQAELTIWKLSTNEFIARSHQVTID